jgi:hypothetical protein
MSKTRKIAFIVEGEKSEQRILENINKHFFSKEKLAPDMTPIILPTGFNIYTLCKHVNAKEEDEELDIIDLLKEVMHHSVGNYKELQKYRKDEFSEIYLFFDYDAHHMRNHSVEERERKVEQMLKTFDNETENGRLFISYPMVESLRDMTYMNLCNVNFECCQISLLEGNRYKQIVGDRAEKNDVTSYTQLVWFDILRNYILKICCLYNYKYLDYLKYIQDISPQSIFNKQQELYILPKKEVITLSGFPEFLIEYYGQHIWDRIDLNSVAINKCHHKYNND